MTPRSVLVATACCGLLLAGTALWLVRNGRATIEPVAGPRAASSAESAPGEAPSPDRGKWRRRDRVVGDRVAGDRVAGDRVPAAAEAAGRSAPAAAAPTPEGELRALPYLAGYRPATTHPTVEHYDPARAWQGLNLVTSGHAAEALLLDMNGQVLHRWRCPLTRAWPELAGDEHAAQLDYWRRVALLPDGSLLAIYDGLGLIELDRGSNVKWAHRGGIHHDLVVADDGAILALDRDGHVVPRFNPDQGILEDFITILTPDGKVRSRLSILSVLERSDYASLLTRAGRQGDIFHTNTLELLDGTGADRLPALAKGNLLVSILGLDTVAVIDPHQERVVWALSGLWRKQHQPTLLPGPRLLVFDNIAGAETSRVLEVDPLTQAVVWRYGGQTAGQALWSKTLGSVARLPNGNTLITESEGGRALEVTSAGETVWQLWNPYRVPDPKGGGELVASLFEVVRLDRAAVAAWLPTAANAGGSGAVH